MRYARGFFGLQLRFGEQVARVLSVPLPQALLTHTHLFVRLGCGRHVDAAHPLWKDYVDGLAGAPDPLDWTWRFRQAHAARDVGPAIERTCGCFGYERRAPDRLRLHFLPHAVPPGVALARGEIAARRAELARLFETAAREAKPPQVTGFSWLYGLEAYRRLFPAAFLARAHVADPPPWQRMPLWGQFLDRHGEVKRDLAQALLERAAQARTEQELAACFPMQVIATEAPASVFA